jgi:hypothetical protein
MAFQFDPEALRPLIQQIVEATVVRLEDERAALGSRLAFSEAEAAALLGLHSHQLRDERLRGRISASVGPGRKILYSRDSLLAYLARRPWKADSGERGV